MKKTVQLIILLCVAVMLTGCATPYMTDRGRDAADIFTATVGSSFGAKARLGPVHAGLYTGSELGGLRGGEFRKSFNGIDWTALSDHDCTIVSSEAFRPQSMAVAQKRGKLFDSVGLLGLSVGLPSNPSFGRPFGQYIPYFTQCEFAIGILGGVRLGFNPGELVDFLLGWTTLDIFKDDIGVKEI